MTYSLPMNLVSRKYNDLNLLYRCSMALVHSRIGRVFYGRSNNASGGLGSYYKIHTHHALNHHFKTFNGFLKDQIEMLMIDC